MENFFNSMTLDTVALESAILNFEATNNLDEICPEPDVSEAVENATSDMDFMFGKDLFESAVISESSYSVQPATEGIGSKIWGAVKSVLTAIKNAFVKLGNFIKELITGKPAKNPTKPLEKGSDEYEKAISAQADQRSKIPAAMIVINNSIVSFISTEAIDTKKVINEINSILNKCNHQDFSKNKDYNEESLKNVGNDARKKYGDDRKGYVDLNGSNTSKTIDAFQRIRDNVAKSTNNIKSQYEILEKITTNAIDSMVNSVIKIKSGSTSEDHSKAVEADKNNSQGWRRHMIEIVKKDNSEPMEKTYASLQNTLKKMQDLTAVNTQYCQMLLSKGIFNNDDYVTRDELKSDSAKTGFDICKIYLDISKCINQVCHILFNLKTGKFIK